MTRPIAETPQFRLLTFGGLQLLENGEQSLRFGARRLTFLAVLAAAGEEGMGKERLASLFWPESDAERARSALNQLVYVFRQALGHEAIFVGATELRLSQQIATDVQEFREAFARNPPDAAVHASRGPFLDGVNVVGSAALERWIEDSRGAFSRDFVRALSAAVDTARQTGQYEQAIVFAEQLFALDRASPSAALRLMHSFDDAGDTASALRVADQHASWMRVELDLPMNDSVGEFARALRERSAAPATRSPRPAQATSAAGAAFSSPAAPRTTPVGKPNISAMSRINQWRWIAMVGVAGLVAVALGGRRFGTLREVPAATSAMPVMAILPFQVTAPDTSYDYLREGIVDLLAAKLGDGVLSADVPTVLIATRASSSHRDAIDRAAKATKANFVVTGSLTANGSQLSLDASVYDVTAGSAISTTRVTGTRDSVFALIDRLAVQVLSLGAHENAARLPVLSGTDQQAVREYLAGHRAFRSANFSDAISHLQLALAHDSLFAIAALDLMRVSGWVGETKARARARQLAWAGRDKLGAQDRVLFNAVVGTHFPAFDSGREKVVLWERVTQLFPSQPDGWFELADQLFHGSALLDDGIPKARIAALFRTALERDSLYAPALVHSVQFAALQEDTATLRSLSRRARSPFVGGDQLFMEWRLAVAFSDTVALADIRRRFADADAQSLIAIALTSTTEGSYPADAEAALAARLHTARRATELREALTGLHAVALNRGQVRKAARWLDADPSSGAELRDAPFIRLFDAMLANGDGVAAEQAAQALRPSARLAQSLALDSARSTASDTSRAIQATRSLCASAQWDLHQRGASAGPPPTIALRRMADLMPGRSISSEARVCALLLDAHWAVLNKSRRADVVVASLDSAVRSIASMGTLFESTLALSVSRIHELAGHPDRALAAVRRQGYLFKWPNYRAEELQTEGRLALSLGDTLAARRAYTMFLRLRDAPDERALASARDARAVLTLIKPDR